MEIQVRSDETGMRYFETFKEAFEYAEKDKTVWKISWWDTDKVKVRMIRHGDFWNYEPIVLDV